jgi:hypothetical protein
MSKKLLTETVLDNAMVKDITLKNGSTSVITRRDNAALRDTAAHSAQTPRHHHEPRRRKAPINAGSLDSLWDAFADSCRFRILTRAVGLASLANEFVAG